MLNPEQPAGAGTDFPWDDLLDYIEEGRVIPILGDELLQLDGPGDQSALYGRIAQKVAERVRLPPAKLPSPLNLNDVVCAYVKHGGSQQQLHVKVNSVLKEMQVVPPRALTLLAGITDFNLFVSLTFDSLLADAINAVRFGGAAVTREIAYSPGKPEDLPAEHTRDSPPVIYHLLGKAQAGPGFVISDEDLLEFISALQDGDRRPQRLFDSLKSSHLLLIGCQFSNWLARFFIRATKGVPLSLQRGETEILVSSTATADPALTHFLDHFSPPTAVVPSGAAAFIEELATRWQQRHAGAVTSPRAGGAGSTGAARADDPMTPGSIFISYAREDLGAVLRLKSALEAAGLQVWLDAHRLETGDAWDLKIRRNIRGCSLFMPVISANTERRAEGYFRREWRWAEERAQGIAEGVPFLIPVVIDRTIRDATWVPMCFHSVQWTQVPDGIPGREFCEMLIRHVRSYRRQERATG